MGLIHFGDKDHFCIKADIQFWRMPSTSRAYPLPLEKKAGFYRRLFI